MARPNRYPAPRRKRDGGHLSDVEIELLEAVRKPADHKPRPGEGTSINDAHSRGVRHVHMTQNGR
jgi:hypothetical protein